MAPTTTTTEHQPSAERILELDGLRGLAILLVVLCHYITAVPHGRSHSLGSMAGTALGLAASGVDLFFILSGFLIGGILLDSTGSPNYYRTFYLRRFYRIFPVYYLWIALFAVISLVSPQFRLQTPYWVFLAFLQNYSRHRTAIEVMWFGVMWSLGVEEQFYLLAPPLIHNTQHTTHNTQHTTHNKRHLTRILLGVLAFSFILRLLVAGLFGNATHNYWGLSAATFWMPCRADDLALGVLVALAWRTESQEQWIAAHLAYFKYAIVVCTVVLLMLLPWMAKPLYFVASMFGIPLFSALSVDAGNRADG